MNCVVCECDFTPAPTWFSHDGCDLTRPLDLLQAQRLTQVEGHVGCGVTAVGGLVVSGPEVSVAAGGITSRAVDLIAVGVVRGDAETQLVKQRGDLHVDQRDVPPDDGGQEGVLELHDVVKVGGRGDLNGDTTGIGVGLPVLRVALAVGQSDHVTGLLTGGPEVDGLADLVENGHAALATSGGGGRRRGGRDRGAGPGRGAGVGGGRRRSGRRGERNGRRRSESRRRRGRAGRRSRRRGGSRGGRGRGSLEELTSALNRGGRGGSRSRAGSSASASRSGAVGPEVLAALHAFADLLSRDLLAIELVDIDDISRNSRGGVATVQVAVAMAMSTLGGHEGACSRKEQCSVELHRELLVDNEVNLVSLLVMLSCFSL